MYTIFIYVQDDSLSNNIHYSIGFGTSYLFRIEFCSLKVSIVHQIISINWIITLCFFFADNYFENIHHLSTYIRLLIRFVTRILRSRYSPFYEVWLMMYFQYFEEFFIQCSVDYRHSSIDRRFLSHYYKRLINCVFNKCIPTQWRRFILQATFPLMTNK